MEVFGLISMLDFDVYPMGGGIEEKEQLRYLKGLINCKKGLSSISNSAVDSMFSSLVQLFCLKQTLGYAQQ